MRINIIKERVRDWWFPVILTLSLYFIASFIILVGYVPSASMEPTLPQNSIIIGLRYPGTYKNGDVVIFRQNGALLIKRIAAMSGDCIVWENLTYMDALPIPARASAQITVPEDAYFLLGDNTQDSIDSRYWEDPFISDKDIVAKLLFHFPLP